MDNLIDQIKENCKIKCGNNEYIVKTKTWYSLEEDNTAKYIKCELSGNNVLVIIPDDNLIYVGKVIENMNYTRLSDTTIEYQNKIFEQTGTGNQYILNIEFGNKNEVEGKCIFEDYQFNDEIISLGILPEKENIRADVYAQIIDLDDFKIE